VNRQEALGRNSKTATDISSKAVGSNAVWGTCCQWMQDRDSEVFNTLKGLNRADISEMICWAAEVLKNEKWEGEFQIGETKSLRR
jgi:hypothetical protein